MRLSCPSAVISFMITIGFQGKDPTGQNCKVPAGLGSPHGAP